MEVLKISVMDEGSKDRSRPMSDAAEIQNITKKLEEVLIVDKPITINYENRLTWEVSMSQRDNAVRDIRFMIIFFDLPQCVFFSTVSFLDGFLARMMVNSRFLQCLSISCLNIAIEVHNLRINPSQLINLSQSKCSVKDMQRMSKIVIKKLNLNSLYNYRNCLNFLLMYLNVFRCIASYLNAEEFLNRILEEQQLRIKLEILISDATCATYSPILLPLALIEFVVKQFLAKEFPNGSSHYTSEVFYFLSIIVQFQCLAKRSAVDQNLCSSEHIKNVLNNYNHQEKYNPKIQLNASSPIRFTLKKNYSCKLYTVVEE